MDPASHSTGKSLPVHPTTYRATTHVSPPITRRPSRYHPVSKRKQIESELWLLRLGSPGVSQLDVLPENTTGLPAEFDYHSFRFIDFKAQAQTRRQAAQRSAVLTPECKHWFCMDYGFMRASSSDFSGSSTEAEFMAACDTGKTILYIRSILWDLDIPQEAATVLYEDNNGCTAMGNTQKPTLRT